MWTALIVYCLACYVAMIPIVRWEYRRGFFDHLWVGWWWCLAPFTIISWCICNSGASGRLFCKPFAALGRLITRGK